MTINLLIGRKVRGVVMCELCEEPEELEMAGYFYSSGRHDDLVCERCNKRLGDGS